MNQIRPLPPSLLSDVAPAGRRVWVVRRCLGLSQAAFGQLLGRSRRTVATWEASGPPQKQLQRVKALDHRYLRLQLERDGVVLMGTVTLTGERVRRVCQIWWPRRPSVCPQVVPLPESAGPEDVQAALLGCLLEASEHPRSVLGSLTSGSPRWLSERVSW